MLARRDGPAVRGSVEGEELPPNPFIGDHQLRKSYPSTGATSPVYGLASQNSDSHTRVQRRGTNEDLAEESQTVWGGVEDDAETTAWNETASLRNADISVSMDSFTSADIDPETLASLEQKDEPFFPSPQPYSSGFNFAPIPGDVIPSSVVPANRIVPDFDPHSWDKLPDPQQVQYAAPLVSPKPVELPKIVISEWKGDEEAMIKGSREGGGAWKGGEEGPFLGKKRKGDPTPTTPTRTRASQIPHPSITLGQVPSSFYSNLVASSSSSSSPNSLTPSFDPNDPSNTYAEVSDAPSSSSSDASPYVSTDPLFQPWSYNAPLPPSAIPRPSPPPPPMLFKGAPRHPSIVLPAWSLRKAAQLKRAYELNGDGTTHWKPKHKISRAKMAEMKGLAKEDPEKWTMRTLSKAYGLDPEAVRRILRSKWEEKDEWEWDVPGGGGELEEGGTNVGNSLEEDALKMAMNGDDGNFEVQLNGGGRGGGDAVSGGREGEGGGGGRRRKKLSEEDPFGDIDEVDEVEWFMSGGKEFEATAEAKEIEAERQLALQAEGGSSSSSPVKRKPLLTKLSNTPFGKSSQLSPPPRFLPPHQTPTEPPRFTSNPPRPRHDARVNDPSPWIINPPSSSFSSSPSSPSSSNTPPPPHFSPTPTLLQSVLSSPNPHSPEARKKFESQAAAARATIERTRRVLAERRTFKAERIKPFQAQSTTGALNSSAFTEEEEGEGELSSDRSGRRSLTRVGAHADSISVSGSSWTSKKKGRGNTSEEDSYFSAEEGSGRVGSGSWNGSGSGGSVGGYGLGVGGRGERPKPRWEKRAETGGAWGTSTPKSSGLSSGGKGGEGEGKKEMGTGVGRDVDSLFG